MNSLNRPEDSSVVLSALVNYSTIIPARVRQI